MTHTIDMEAGETRSALFDLIALEGELTYSGPERRRGPGSGLARLLSAVLDEIDYGLVLLAADGHVIHANHAARTALDEDHLLQIFNRRVRARAPMAQATLDNALFAAHRSGQRRMLELDDGGRRCGLSIVPLPAALSATQHGHAVLIALAREHAGAPLSIAAYALAHKLSARESEVLAALSAGQRPAEIAGRLGVSQATVRSHVHNLKEKTGCRSMVEVVQAVASLPPMQTALKHS